MAYLVIELNFPGLQIADVNDKFGLNSGDKADALNQAINALAALEAGAQSGTVQLTSRNATASVATSGSGSEQVSYS
jgi:hypothetical protein